jgi:hypothetical protein
MKITQANENGRYDFHIYCIKVSNLILGKLALTQMKAKVKNVVLIPKLMYPGIIPSVNGIIGNHPPQNSKAVISDI